MKTKITGSALGLVFLPLALATLAVLPAAASTLEDAPFALPGEETPLALEAGFGLLAPPHPALAMGEPANLLPCPAIYPSLAGDLTGSRIVVVEKTSKPAEPRNAAREVYTLAANASTPEPNVSLLAALAGILMTSVRRRKIS